VFTIDKKLVPKDPKDHVHISAQSKLIWNTIKNNPDGKHQIWSAIKNTPFSNISNRKRDISNGTPTRKVFRNPIQSLNLGSTSGTLPSNYNRTETKNSKPAVRDSFGSFYMKSPQPSRYKDRSNKKLYEGSFKKVTINGQPMTRSNSRKKARDLFGSRKVSF
jgi:hypothetical protein